MEYPKDKKYQLNTAILRENQEGVNDRNEKEKQENCKCAKEKLRMKENRKRENENEGNEKMRQ